MKNLTLIFALLFFPWITFSQNKNSDPLETDFAKHISKGDSLVNLKQFDAAIKYYDRAIGNATDKTTAYHKRAMAFFAQKDYPKAINDFSLVIESNVGLRKDAYFFRGMSRISSDTMRLDGCEDLAEAKKLGFITDWEGLQMICPDLD